MKKKVSDFVKAAFANCFTSYSGKKKTMYITNLSGIEIDIEDIVIKQFGELPFKLKTNA